MTEKYPVDSASFRNIRERGFVYVDKTKFIQKLTDNGTYYFLARPRRFGKSMFLDTLAEYFNGNRNLFKGLAIDTLHPQDWIKYPVLKFNLTGDSFLSPDALNILLEGELRRQEDKYGITNKSTSVSDRFFDLIDQLSQKYEEKVVILIDEYDAPLASAIDRPELQKIYREQLQGFYSVLKKADNHVKFCMLTGVTRFGKVSVFSGLNNLNDITFDDEYAGICGITKEELISVYDSGIKALADKEGLSFDETVQLLKFHYDGYHFSPAMLDIYNPFSINHAFAKKAIKDYWCMSGTPTLLAKTLMKNDFDITKLDGLKVQEPELRDLSMYAENPVPLFYQTGYLTLKSYDPKKQRFTLRYPNREVESSILRMYRERGGKEEKR